MAVEYGVNEIARRKRRDPRATTWTPEMVAVESLDIGLRHLERVYGYECKAEE